MVQAVVLCAGYGTRLKPLTDKTPKGMLPVKGIPILQHIINSLRESGIKDIIMCVGYKKEQIIKYFKKGENYDVGIKYSKETKPKNTATTLLKARKLIKYDNFLVVNGDTIYKGEYKYLIYDHIKYGNQVTILTHYRSLGSAITTTGHNSFKVKDYLEKPEFMVNSGVYMFNKEVLHHLEGNAEITDLFGYLDCHVSPCTGPRVAIDSIDKLQEANALFE